MTITRLPTEPLRAEDRDLLQKLQGFHGLAADLHGFSAPYAGNRLEALIGFLHTRVAPHAAAEEAVLYPYLETVMGGRAVTVPFRADHLEIGARIDVLAETTLEVGDRWPDETLGRSLSRQVIKLAAVIMLHLGKEQELLFPVLDERLSPEEVRGLLERMEDVAHAWAPSPPLCGRQPSPSKCGALGATKPAAL